MEFGDWGPICECGHTEWHHTGLREPGCTFLGSCACSEFVASGEYQRPPRRTAKERRELAARVTHPRAS